MRFSKRFRSTSNATTARITGSFWLLVLLICGLFLQAYMHNFNIVYITLFFLVGFGIVSEFMGRTNLSRLDAALLSRGRFFARTPAAYRLRLTNRGDTPSYAVTVENGRSRSEVRRVDAASAAIVTLEAQFDTRGAAVLPPAALESFYPLPHLRFGKRFEEQPPLVIYPEPKGEPLQELLARQRAAAGERDDFEGIRRYESGDTASLIYWPSVARGETVMSKHFLYEEPSRTLRFEFAASGSDDEARLSQLTLWVLECEKASLPFKIAMPGGVELDSAEEGIDAILETLARY